MSVRTPAVAGRFYPGDPDQCRRELDELIPRSPCDVSGRIWGAIMPHAGWMCSGAVAGQVAAAVSRRRPATAVIFGAVHVHMRPVAQAYPAGQWKTPLGLMVIDADLVNAIVSGSGGLVEADAQPHAREHSIEVEVPFVQQIMPAARLVAIMTPPTGDAHRVGEMVGRVCRERNADVVFLGSTDLTHYGPSYGFCPRGVGLPGLEWARNVNDRRIIDLMLAMRADAIVEEADRHGNACGAGAIAATIAASRAMGAMRAELLAHTTSYEVLRARYDEPPTDAVGYAGIVFVE